MNSGGVLVGLGLQRTQPRLHGNLAVRHGAAVGIFGFVGAQRCLKARDLGLLVLVD